MNASRKVQVTDSFRVETGAGEGIETCLVLSAAAQAGVIEQTLERFAPAQPVSCVLTKLDEAVSFGVLVNVMQHLGKRLSFVTTGQEVPDHIEPGRADRLAELVLSGGWSA